ncbi:tRNA (guanine-N(7)-)-methyltransferase non-catalytic subunit wdr4 isoform X4 [Syngnathus typhle]|uniref:tRNA (guanine-N(7)-)-methyltransferase non-catalytic subunit wdr4 isoform X4 n=1 Tax=Syngnathus typhle TaxID=161592 RepID=UPI002A69B03F|nr:tRNA (guanine-N(7)-)-methyltransferase non-catalytic subunit wdr4 isoform X4 [Syngnathus typhle]
MASIGVCGKWMFLSCGTRLIAAHIKKDREPFVFDCSTAKKKENDPKACINSLGGPSGSDIIVSLVISPSGKLVALIDDSKRLVLFKNEHSWQWASTRWLVRRGTSLVFNRAEDEVLVADKSGDVYSFSVMQPEKEGELKMGHLSMILAVTVSLDDKYIITSDRDEKIRVSHRCSPYNIQSFCLGHKEFVSSLLVPSGDRHWLLSGSGKVIVCHITSSFDGCHIAVQFDRKLEEEGVEDAIALLCIIHQQALCSKILRYDNVMSDVVKIINHSRSWALKHRQFRECLAEIESEYEDVLYFTEELNVLNKKLQGQDQLVSAAYDNVRAFFKTLVLWKAQLFQTNLCPFPACKALMDSGTTFSGEKYADTIGKLQEEFDQRFADFKTHRATFQTFADPFSFDVEDAPLVLQMELIDLQCHTDLKAKFREPFLCGILDVAQPHPDSTSSGP